MCALVTPIIKSDYKLYPGMPVKKKTSGSSGLPSSNNNLSVVHPRRTRSESLRSNISAQSNPEFSIDGGSTNAATTPSSNTDNHRRQRCSASMSMINKDDLRREKLRKILEEKERQRKISNTSSSDNNNGNSVGTGSKGNPFLRLFRRFSFSNRSQHKTSTTTDDQNNVQEVLQS